MDGREGINDGHTYRENRSLCRDANDAVHTYIFIFEAVKVQVVPMCNVGQQVEIVDGVAIDIDTALAYHEYHICQQHIPLSRILVY